MECPTCHLINPDSAQICDCGYNFMTSSQGAPITLLEANPRVGSWFSRGWSAFKNNPRPLIHGSVTISVVLMIIEVFARLPRGWIIARPTEIILVPILYVWWSFLCIKTVRGSNARVADPLIERPFKSVWGTPILLSLIVISGLFLFIVPGIIWGLKFGFCLFALVDWRLTPLEAIRISGKITKGYKPQLLLAGLTFTVITLLIDGPILLYLKEGKSDPLSIVVLLILYLTSMVLVSPWMGAVWATAYDSLVLKYGTPSEL